MTLLVPVVLAEPTLSPLRPGERPVAGSTEAELWYGWNEAEKSIAASPNRVRDPKLNAYVQDVVCKVAADACGDLRLYILDDPQFNTLMAPNGMVLVDTGTLLRLHDEAELAILLGHEFAHFRERHGLQAWERKKSAAASLSNSLDYSRDLERDADRTGLATAIARGYDPNAGARLWSRVLREERAGVSSQRASASSGHPKTEERVEDMRAAAAAAVPSAGGYRDNRDAYHAAMHPFLAHWLDQELSRRTYDASIQAIGDIRDGAPPDVAGTLAYYLAQAYRQRGRDGDAATASRLYDEAIAQPDAPPEAWREVGLDLRQGGQRAAAAKALHRYLQLQPQASDRAFIDKYLAELESAP